MKSLHLRLATRSDIPLLTEWENKPHIQASTGSDGPWDWTEAVTRQEEWRHIFIAEIIAPRPDPKTINYPIGFIQKLDPARDPEAYWGKLPAGYRALDIWIGEEACLGQGYGSAMMHQVIDLCFADQTVHTLLIDPLAKNLRAQKFYQRLGFVPFEKRYLGQDLCQVMILSRMRYKTNPPVINLPFL